MNLTKYLPDTITCLNLLSGSVAVIFAFRDDFDAALGMIVLAAVFDFLDGLAARVFHAYSDIGKELDSLADTVSFGLAPSLILYNWLAGFTSCIHPYVCYIPLLIAAFSALRLAKFNLDTRQSERFLGRPVPPSAPPAASLAAFAGHYEHIANTFLANNWANPCSDPHPLRPAGERASDVFHEAQDPQVEGQCTAIYVPVHNNTRRSHSPYPEDTLDGYRIHCLRVLHRMERGRGTTPKTASRVSPPSRQPSLPWHRNRT